MSEVVRGVEPEGAKLVRFFIRLMIPKGSIRSRDQRTAIMSLHGVIKRPLQDNTDGLLFIGFMVPDNLCNKTAALCNQY